MAEARRRRKRSAQRARVEQGRSRSGDRRVSLLVGAVLVAAVLAIYWPVRSFPFVSLDDPLYVTNNEMVQRGLTLDGVRWAFQTFHANNWHPLTWLSHMLDSSLFGSRASGMQHMVNVSFHALNAVLLFAILRSTTGALGRSAAVALLFAVHPLRVESVAWLSERKDVLSTALGLSAILAWVGWTRRGGTLRYLLALGWMALSLLAKPMLVTLPGILLLLDIWPLRRLDLGATPRETFRRAGSLVLEKLPFVVLAGAASIVTLSAQSSSLGTLESVPLLARLTIAISGVAGYLRLIFWPRGLAALYPLVAPPLWQWLGSLALVGAVTAIAVAGRRARPWLLVGWLWFLVTLLPVIGLVSVGAQSIADRYTYVPAVGLTIVLVWLVAELLQRAFGRRRGERIAVALAGATAMLLAIAARAQVQVWSDSVVLYRHAIAVTPPNWFMQNLLGTELASRGDLAGARLHTREAVRIQPSSIDALNNLAALLIVDPDPAGRDAPEALRLAERAVSLSPEPAATVLDTLAAAYADVGRFDDAARVAQRASEAATRAGRADLVAQTAEAIARYRAGQPPLRQIHVNGAPQQQHP